MLSPLRRLWLASALVAAVFAALVATGPVDAFWTPDGGMKYLEMTNLRWTGHGFDAPITYPARPIDPENRLVPMMMPRTGPDGQLRGPWPLLFPLLSSLPYGVLGLRGLLLLPLFGGAACALLAGL